MIWKCRDKEIEYGSRTLIMGIVNVTPDSFSDGGDNFSPYNAIETIIKMIMNGVDIIDIGAQSTRPGYTLISPEEEWKRLEPVLKQVCGKIRMPISVDTFYPQVAANAIQCGADIINDVSGVISPHMAKIVKETGAGWIVMHNGSGDIEDVKYFFKRADTEIKRIGIDKKQICFDMGIGFGKTRSQDMELISNVRKYKMYGYPLLLACSRKRVIREGSRQNVPKKRIYGNIAADTAAILGGVDIVRLHDVENEKQGIYMADALKNALK